MYSCWGSWYMHVLQNDWPGLKFGFAALILWCFQSKPNLRLLTLHDDHGMSLQSSFSRLQMHSRGFELKNTEDRRRRLAIIRIFTEYGGNGDNEFHMKDQKLLISSS
ncbi:hypothetical protein K1719_024863 [Acacia pycnantha]|nr:hypothetical protein K1719_024863 [Acacia pycnantha]